MHPTRGMRWRTNKQHYDLVKHGVAGQILKQWNKMKGGLAYIFWQVRWGDNKYLVNLTLNSWMFCVLCKSKQLGVLTIAITSNLMHSLSVCLIFAENFRQHRTWVPYWYWKSINRTNDFIYYLPLESMSNNRKALSSWQGDKQQFWKVPAGLSLTVISAW